MKTEPQVFLGDFSIKTIRGGRRDIGEKREGWTAQSIGVHVDNEAEEDANEGEKEEGEEKEVDDEDDDDDCADLDGHGRGVSVTAGGKKRVLTRFRHDRAPLAARPISQHF